MKTKTVYLFFRDTGFYPIELDSDFDAVENAKCNPGTIRVENALTNEIVWMPPVKEDHK